MYVVLERGTMQSISCTQHSTCQQRNKTCLRTQDLDDWSPPDRSIFSTRVWAMSRWWVSSLISWSIWRNFIDIHHARLLRNMFYSVGRNQSSGVTFWMTSSFSFSTVLEAPEWECECKFFNSLSILANSFCSCLTSAFSVITTFTCALVWTCLAQFAKWSVFLDCSTWVWAGLMVQIIAVLALPPKEVCSMRVSFESLYGICPLFPPLLHHNTIEEWGYITQILHNTLVCCCSCYLLSKAP